jgi:hypothetical protein
MGPFKKASGVLTHLLIKVNKFTKWIKVKPLAKICSKQAVDSIQDIIFCFEVPNSIITNMAFSSPEKNLGISVMTRTSAWTRTWSPTCAQMDRLSVLMA